MMATTRYLAPDGTPSADRTQFTSPAGTQTLYGPVSTYDEHGRVLATNANNVSQLYLDNLVGVVDVLGVGRTNDNLIWMQTVLIQ